MTENEVIQRLKNRLKTEEQRYGKEFVKEYFDDIDFAISALKAIQQYREIGTVEECREAVEKQKPKRAVLRNDNGKLRKSCPVCGCFFSPLSRSCPKCGQAIQWDEDLEETEDEL